MSAIAHTPRELSVAAALAFKQRLRLRSFWFASIFSALYVVVLTAFFAFGGVGRGTLVEASVIVAVLILVFFGLIRSGLNLKFPDPSLTAWQMQAAVGTMLYVVYHAPETRLAFNAFFFAALLFAMLRHSGGKLALLGAASVLSFALVVWLRYLHNGDGEALRLDMLLCGVMAVTFPWFIFIGDHVKRLKRGLSEASVRLEDIEERAQHDELTGIYNRRALMLAMEEARKQADATGEPLSLCVIDLDLFKRFNDEYNHLVGDRVLQEFAQAAQAELRATDVFGRYGGEEFVKILRQTALAGAKADAERLRARISHLDLRIPDRVDPLTVSIGVAQYQPGETINQTFARADAALYRAKQGGRNRVEG